MKGRKLFFISLVLLFFLGCESGGFQISLMNMAEELNLSGIQSGSLVAAQYSAIIVMPLLAGIAAERTGKLKVLRMFCFVFMAGCVMVTAAASYGILLAGIFIIGAGYSVCESLVSAVLTEAYQERAGRYLNMVQGAFSLGAVSGPHLAVWAIKQGIDWRGLFVFCGGGFLLCLMPLCRHRGRQKDRQQKEKVSYRIEKKFSSSFLLLVLAFLLYGGMEVGSSYYMDAYMETELHSARLGVWAVSLFWLLMVPARLLSGWLYRYRKILLSGSFLMAAPVFLLIAFTEKGKAGVVLFAFLGLLLGSLWPNLMGTAMNDYQECAAMAAGLMSVGCGAGAVVFPLLFGTFMEQAGLRNGFLMLAACSLAGGGLCICYQWKNQKSAKNCKNAEGIPKV